MRRHGSSKPWTPSASAAAVALTAVGLLAIGCSDDELNGVNHMPVILSVTCADDCIITGETVMLLAEAVDEDGDGLQYSWTSEAGSFDIATGATAAWVAPENGGTYEVRVTVNDRSATATASVRLRVLPAQFGGEITVDSSPRNAEIVVDGVNTGWRTDHTFPPGQCNFPVGEHVISLLLTGRYLFPDTSVVFIREDRDTTLSYTFVTTSNVGNLGPSIVAYPPQLSPDGFFVVWSDDRNGLFEVRQNGVNAGSGDSFQSPEPVGYDGAAYFPNWGMGGISRLLFQTSVADTGSRVYDFSIFGGPVRPYQLGGDTRQARVSVSNTQIAFVRHEKEGAIFRTRLMLVTGVTSASVVTGTVQSLLEFESTVGRIELSTPVFSADETRLIYSRRTPDGSEDIYLYDVDAGLEHRLTTTGDRAWPAFGTADRIVFFHVIDSASQAGSAGVFGAALDDVAWRLGRAMWIGPAGARNVSFGRASSGQSKRLAYLTGDGIIISDNFSD